MTPDEIKEAWQTQTSQTRLTIDVELLLQEVQRNQQYFSAMIFWRDVREVGTALVLAGLSLYVGIGLSMPWTWYLASLALVWIGGFMLTDRMRHKRRPPGPSEPLRPRLECSLAQVEHQIWLLRNVFWWYLLPIAVAVLPFFVHSAWQDRAGGWWIALALGLVIVFTVAVLGVVYWVNQIAVRSAFEPRRQELEMLLVSLQDESPPMTA